MWCPAPEGQNDASFGCLRLESEPDGRERRLVQAMSYRWLASGARPTLMGHFADAEDKGLLPFTSVWRLTATLPSRSLGVRGRHQGGQIAVNRHWVLPQKQVWTLRVLRLVASVSFWYR